MIGEPKRYGTFARCVTMSIPDYQSFMLPLLEAVSDGKSHVLRDLTRQLSNRFGLSEDERQELLPSGQQTVVANRVAWAKTYLKKAGLLANPTRGYVTITKEGTDALAQHPVKIDNEFLRRYPSYMEFVKKAQPEKAEAQEIAESPATPEELLESSYRSLRDALADELLERVKACSFQFFERLVVDLLLAMGYGGSRADAGKRVGRTGDGGIDGIINEDKLGLDIVCLQAKRWENTVGRPDVQKFAGSMEGHRAKKGVLLTTSIFSEDAKEYVNRIERKIVLIDGRQLAQLMIDHGIGVETDHTYVIKKLDLDYFDEERE